MTHRKNDTSAHSLSDSSRLMTIRNQCRPDQSSQQSPSHRRAGHRLLSRAQELKMGSVVVSVSSFMSIEGCRGNLTGSSGPGAEAGADAGSGSAIAIRMC